MSDLKTQILSTPERKIYVKVSGWLVAGEPIRVQRPNRPEEECVIHSVQANIKAPFGTHYQNGVEQTERESAGIVGHDLQLLFEKDENAGRAKLKLFVAGRAFEGKISPQSLGMENIDLSERPHPQYIAKRLITSDWILPNRRKLFGAFYATVNAEGNVELWKPSHFTTPTRKFFFTNRPEQTTYDELNSNIWISNTLAKCFAAAAIASFSGMIACSQQTL